MAPGSSSQMYLVSRRTRPAWLAFSLCLLLGLAVVHPINAEHLSHSRSHARRSLENSSSNAKRAPVPQDVPVRQLRGSLINLDAPGFGIVLGGDDGQLLGINLTPNSSSESASATDTTTSSLTPPSSSDSTVTASSTSTDSESSSDSAVSGSTPTSLSSASAPPPASSSAPTSSVSPSTSDVATQTSPEPTPTTSCAIGASLLGIGLNAVCVTVTPTASTTASESDVPVSSESGSGAASSQSTSAASQVSTAAPESTTTSTNTGSSPADSGSTSCGGALSVNLLGLTVCALPTTSESSTVSTSSVPTVDPSDSGSATSPEPVSSTVPSPSSSDASTTCSGLLCGILPTPTTSDAGASSSSESCTGLLCGILPTDSSSTDTPASSETPLPGSTVSSSESESTTCSGLLCGILPTLTTSNDEPATSTGADSLTTSDLGPTDTITSNSEAPSCSGLLCSITSVLPPITSAPGENSTITDGPTTTTTAPDTTVTQGDNSTVTDTATSIGDGTNSTTLTTITATPGENATATTSAGNVTTETSISFPTGGNTSTSLVTLTATPTVSTTLASQFSFLTQSSLLFSEASSTASSSLTTLTNPDEPTSSAVLESAVTGATVSSIPLPSGLPARIYPAEGGVTGATDLTDYSTISILFDAGLAWPFVASQTDSAAQIFAYFPPCLQVALGISADQVKTFALQVYETSQYKSPNDLDELRTLFIGYVPADNVTALEQAIKAKQSDLYTRTTGISAQLAQRIDASYSVTSYPDPISPDPNSPGGSDGSSGSSNSRRDAIIGVCSALGGIALCILGFLLYRNFKRRKEAAHHRLQEPQTLVGPTPGQDFDRDSIGGQRRRSFYYAEDSLRGFSQPVPRDDIYAHTISPAAGGGMRERRPIAPGTISAPILRDNTLNW